MSTKTSFVLDKENLLDAIVELIHRASSDLPTDVVQAIECARNNEDDNSVAKNVFNAILENIKLAHEESLPICQDTGTNIYYIHYPSGISMQTLRNIILKATRQATAKAYLRPNAVDSLTGKNSGDNVGIGAPYLHFEEWNKDYLHIKLMLKGGGSENVSGQYKLPDPSLSAGRDLNGIYKVVVDTVNKAQGLGCAPGILGIGIGGDRATSHIIAKKQLLRKLDDVNPITELASLEKRLLKDLNKLGIGPMGLGGKTTVMGVKIGHMHRLPACFFVSIGYLCWACRRHSLIVRGEIYSYD